MATVAVSNTDASILADTLVTEENANIFDALNTFNAGIVGTTATFTGNIVADDATFDVLAANASTFAGRVDHLSANTSRHYRSDGTRYSITGHDNDAAYKQLSNDADNFEWRNTAGSILAKLTGSGLLTINTAGTHTFTGASASSNRLDIINTTSGTGAFVDVALTAGTTGGNLQALSQGFTPSGSAIASTVRLVTTSTGGLVFAATDAAGMMRFFSGGSTERGRLTASGNWVFKSAFDDAELNGERAPITSIVRPPTGAGQPDTGRAQNAWIGFYPAGENPGAVDDMPGPDDLVSIYHYVTTPNSAAAYQYGIWARNTLLVRFPDDTGCLYGDELDFVNQEPWGAGGVAFPGQDSSDGLGSVVGIGCIITTPAYNGSAAFFCSIGGSDGAGPNARWEYGIVLAGCEQYGVYVGGRDNSITGEDTNGDGVTGINVDPVASFFNDTDATSLIETTGTHTNYFNSPYFVVTEKVLTMANRDNGNGAGNYGQIVQIGSNTNGTNTAPGTLGLGITSGQQAFIWADTTGDLRIRGTAAATGTPPYAGEGDTVGTVVGDQTSSLDSKDLRGAFADDDEALQVILDTPLYRFAYKSGKYGGQEFVGVVTDYAPTFGKDRDVEHPAGKSLNEITLHGYELAAIKALARRVEALEEN